MMPPTSTYDPDASGTYVRLSDKPVATTRRAGVGVLVDYDADGQPVGVEVIGRQRSAPLPTLPPAPTWHPREWWQQPTITWTCDTTNDSHLVVN